MTTRTAPTLTDVLADLQRINAVLSPLPNGNILVLCPHGALTPDLREHILAWKPALRVLARWDQAAADRILADLQRKIDAMRPADYPASWSPEWDRSADQIVVNYVAHDAIGFLLACRQHLRFARQAFQDWQQLQHIITEGSS